MDFLISSLTFPSSLVIVEPRKFAESFISSSSGVPFMASTVSMNSERILWSGITTEFVFVL
ncbi:MAG: hypothetical protein LUD29_05845 [Clostridia bacterium]|nr:hypothetical protein [Clostridia bacterium]